MKQLFIFIVISLLIATSAFADTIMDHGVDTPILTDQVWGIDDPGGTPDDSRFALQAIADLFWTDLAAGDIPDISATYQIVDTELTKYAGVDPSANMLSTLGAVDYDAAVALWKTALDAVYLGTQTIGIANDNIVEVDDADAANLDIAQFTANGLQGLSYAELVAILDDVAWTFGAVAVDLSAATVTLPSTIDYPADSILFADLDDDGNYGTFTGNWTWDTGTFLLENGLNLGTAGVVFTDDGDGALTITGAGDGSDEDLTFNFDDTANTIVLSSSTGVTDITIPSTMAVSAGGVDAGNKVTLSTAATVTVSGNSGFYVNNDDDAIEFDLPADPIYTINSQVYGKVFCFDNNYAQIMVIDPNGTDVLKLDGLDGAAGENNDTTGAITDHICYVGQSASLWKSYGNKNFIEETPP